MHHLSRAGLAVLLVIGPLAAPALAEDAPQALFDQRVSMEWQAWNWVGSGSNAGSLGYSTPMTVFTVTDRTGVLMGAATAAANNEGRRRSAEQDAIRNDKRSYSYDVEEGHALEGSRLSFTVGMGAVNGAFGGGNAAFLAKETGVMAKMARLDLEADIFEVGGGSFVFNTGIASWSAGVPGAVVTSNSFNLASFDLPLGLKYRWAPSFLPGLVIEPEANFNWLYTLASALNGGAKWGAHTMGVDVGYYILPTVKVRASYYLDRLAHDKLDWMQDDDMADLKAANVGLMMTF
ncbi:MAG: hypothetical protein JWM80_5855 [Cyanobacteria bacterium RYN_339]|nr:hypothetical protein [Cyanobacteria bacterium RYN_339]